VRLERQRVKEELHFIEVIRKNLISNIRIYLRIVSLLDHKDHKETQLISTYL
jgi:hypothetical protein